MFIASARPEIVLKAKAAAKVVADKVAKVVVVVANKGSSNELLANM